MHKRQGNTSTASRAGRLDKGCFVCLVCLPRCRSRQRGNQLLPPVAGGSRPAVRSSRGAAVGLPGAHGALALRRRALSPHWLPRGHALGRVRVHLHVDLRGQIPRRQETPPIRDRE